MELNLNGLMLNGTCNGEPNDDLYSVKDSCSKVILDTIAKDELLLMQFLFGEKTTIVAGYENQYTNLIEDQMEKCPEGEEFKYFYETY